MTTRVTVLGAGPGGYVAAIRAAQLGAHVTVIEERDVGGTCLNRGCIPSKIMITAATMLEKLRRSSEFGLRVEGAVYPDMELLLSRKREVIEGQAKGVLSLFHHHKIIFVSGKGMIKKHGLATARAKDGKTLEVPWDRLILAPGTEPLELPLLPFDGKWILSSDDALSLGDVPASILILGGGAIGCEFACLFAGLGSRVILVEAMDRLLPLPSFDEDCSKLIEREMRKRKIRVFLERTARSVEARNGKLHVTMGRFCAPGTKESHDEAQVEVVDKILVCVGRQPNTSNIGLEGLQVLTDARGWITANERMETSAPGVYAIGDVLGPSKMMLAHVASAEGGVAAQNATGQDARMDYNIVPSVIFTMPEAAAVGLTETGAGQRGWQVRSDRVFFRSLGKPHVIGEIAGETKIVSDRETGKLLGVQIVGPHATDLIAEAALAIKMGATVRDVSETIHGHPTLPEVLGEAACKALDRSVHSSPVLQERPGQNSE
jgi:dihydrolipoamide dehydrogenase